MKGFQQVHSDMANLTKMMTQPHYGKMKQDIYIDEEDRVKCSKILERWFLDFSFLNVVCLKDIICDNVHKQPINIC